MLPFPCVFRDLKACDTSSDFRVVATRVLDLGTSGFSGLPLGIVIFDALPGKLSPHQGGLVGKRFQG